MDADIVTVCERTIIGPSGTPSLHGIFDLVNAERFPAAIEMTIAVRVRGKPGESAIATSTIAQPDTGTIGAGLIMVTINPAGIGWAFFELKRFPLASGGLYTVRAAIDGVVSEASSTFAVELDAARVRSALGLSATSLRVH